MGRAARRLGEDADPKWVIGVHLPRNTVQSMLNIVQLSRSTFKEAQVEQRQQAAPNKHARAGSGLPAAAGGSRSLWFNPPIEDPDRRPQLTRERIVTEALAVIAQDDVQALTMRRLAARLGVVPGALYHHVGNKQQLQDLLLDGVLAEIDLDLDPALGWSEQLKVLAHRLRQVLEAHPGIAGILKTRDPLGPHSLALAEAFLSPLQTAGFGDREAGLAFFLLLDYTIGFAVSTPATSVNEQRVRDQAIRSQLHQFFRSLPPDRFPALVAVGEHVWVDNRDERFTAGLQVLADGLEHARNAPRPPAPKRRPTTTTTTRGRQPAQQTTDGDTQRRRTR
jgi:TetR/AcrR family tetracycline transcriptional repressor